MEEYQYNFTTREQSKKLMDIGVPADSADCYYNKYINMPYVFNKRVTFSKYAKVEDIIPCWSTGRLIEIYEICLGLYYSHSRDDAGDNLIESIINKIEEAIKANSDFPDLYPGFYVSRLENKK